jgi:hypothetical protein
MAGTIGTAIVVMGHNPASFGPASIMAMPPDPPVPELLVELAPLLVELPPLLVELAPLLVELPPLLLELLLPPIPPAPPVCPLELELLLWLVEPPLPAIPLLFVEEPPKPPAPLGLPPAPPSPALPLELADDDEDSVGTGAGLTCSSGEQAAAKSAGKATSAVPTRHACTSED